MDSVVRFGGQGVLLTFSDLAGSLLAILGAYGIWIGVLGHELLLWQVASLTALSLAWVAGLAVSKPPNNRPLKPRA